MSLVVMFRHRIRHIICQLLLLGVVACMLYTWWLKKHAPSDWDRNAPGSCSFAKLLTAESDYPNNLKMLSQEDAILQEYAYYRHMTPPSKEPYNILGPTHQKFQNTFSYAVSRIMKNKKNGTFIEAGAYDGVAASNTLYLEKTLGWTGLLVECNPVTLPFLKLKKRKAWIADVCLSPTKNPATVDFSNPVKWGPSAKIGAPADLTKYGVDTTWTQFQVQALPLYSLLAAIDLKTIDFFSLDVEGVEFDILKTIPFDKIKITILCLEVAHFSKEVKSDIQHFLEGKGFRLYTDFESDHLYVHSTHVIE